MSAGIDWGWSDPLAIEVQAQIGPVWLNFYEVYEEKIPIVDVLKIVRKIHLAFGVQRFWADSEDPKMVEYLQSHGLPVIPNQIKSIDFGLRTVYGLMKQVVDHPLLGVGPRFRVARRQCPGLVREAALYAAKDGKIQDRNNHAWDAVRYAMTGEGEIPPDVVEKPSKIDQPTMTVNKQTGEWFDNPIATMARRGRRYTEYEGGKWWDEETSGGMLEIIGEDDLL